MEEQDIKFIGKIKSSIGKIVYFYDDNFLKHKSTILGYCLLGGKISVIVELYSNPFETFDKYRSYIMNFLRHRIKYRNYKIYKKCNTDFMTIINKRQIKL